MEIKALPRSPGIYSIRHQPSGKVYVGSAISLRKRLNTHLSDLRKNKHHSNRLQNAWNKYGSEMFCVEVLLLVDDKKQLIEQEQHFLDLLEPFKPHKGYNICPRAGSMLGHKFSKEAKEKIGKLSAERWLDPEYKENMRKQTREQMKYKRKPFMCVETGQTFESTRSAASVMGLDASSVTKVLRGRMIQTRGYTFKYLAEPTPICQRKRRLSYQVRCDNSGKVYKSCLQAALDTGVSDRMIREVAQGKRKTVKGLSFSFV